MIERLAKSLRKKLAPTELTALAQTFIEAGTQAVRAQIGSALEAAQAVDYARQLSEAGRMQLARRTTGHPKKRLQNREWARLDRVLVEHQETLTNWPGVIGIGLGHRVKSGIWQAEKTITVYVERKLMDAELGSRLAIPTTLRAANGDAVGVDVVEFGKFRRNTSGGSSLGQGNSRGTLGVLAQDNASASMVALTAQHVVGDDTPPGLELFAPWPQTSTSVLVGRFLRGTMHETDAAAIEVADPDTMIDYIPEIGRVNGWRPVVDSDRGMPVWMYGAVSGYQLGMIQSLHNYLPQEDLIDAIVVRIQASPGDSGAVILDRQNLVLGLLVGAATVPICRFLRPSA
ncbi:S1 family peptidase [Hymenobacter sp. 5317J-9]|uniref:S1 family peptidase n=1 Tax=Hymenobacter sp. 5317J-9 TaxID=2932250 RepID=UPI001FD6B471|nr:S1 family peptidase [Hymenobacter sp. 5317J-9]UOQ98022.1 S1 family peptidase [Hymenobacter sp. 5317J-9]